MYPYLKMWRKKTQIMKFKIRLLLIISLISVQFVGAQKSGLKLGSSITDSVVIQKVSAPIFRLELGSTNPKQAGNQFSTSYFNGGRIGGTVEFDLKHNFSFLTGALYSLVYSNKVQNYTFTDSVRYKTFAHSIDIPLQINYNLPLGKNLKLIAFAGSNINVGLAQPQKVQVFMTNEQKSFYPNITDKEYADNDLYKNALIHRINFQMVLGGGVQWKDYQVKAGYNFGINSINRIDSGQTLRQSGWFVSLAYQF